MRTKNAKKTQAASPARDAPAKRQRRQSPSSRTTVEVPSRTRDDAQEPSPILASDKPAEEPPETWSMILARVADQPYRSQILQYKDWRRTGSLHNDKCCICHEPDNLEPCHTCSLAFHSGCLPHGWRRNSYDQLFCPICVARGWNISPPVLTPPPSPRPTQSQLPTILPAPNAYSSVSGTWDFAAQKPNQEAPPAQQSFSRDVQAAQISDNPTDANSHTQISGSTMIAVGTTEPKRRQRKSQYSTLSAEVNSALSTIYRELESVADLRAQITELTSTNIQLKQDLVVMDQRHTATQRMLMALRAKTMASETTNEDVNALRTKIASLEAELQASREETAAAKELKERLAQLLSN